MQKNVQKYAFFIKKNDYKGMSIEINCTGSDTIQLHELTEFQGELKERSAGDVEKIIKSIKKHGFSFPFFVWKNDGKNNVIDGHGRFKALQQMAAAGEEIPALPCVYISAKNEAEAKEKLLKLNSQYGHMTAESVADFLDGMEIELDDLALPDGVLDLSGIAAPEEETEGDDEAPALDEDGEPDSQPGEMYELGNSILMCGSSTDENDVKRLCAGVTSELLFTSPPYSDMRTYNGNKDLSVENIVNFIRTYKDYAKYMCVNLGIQRKDGAINPYWDEYTDTAKDVGLKMLAWNVWNKTMAGSIGNQAAMFPIEHEWIFVYGTETKEINATVEKRNKKQIGKTLKKTTRNKDGTCRTEMRKTTNSKYKKMESVLELLPEMSDIRKEHTATFPVKLPEAYIKAMTNESDVIIEPFGGSGTTLIAAEKLGRSCRIMELDPKYCDVIRKRWTKWAKENGREVGTGGLE